MRRVSLCVQCDKLRVASLARTAAALTAAARFAACLLCDVDYDSWGEHSARTSHIARSAICRTFVAPDRHDAMMQQLWKHIRLDFEYIDDVTHKKEDRRRSRIASTISHLRARGVLRESIPQLAADGTVVVAKDSFVNLMMLGEAYARQETLDRAARLMPRLDAHELSSVAHYILSKRHLARLFDLFNMSALCLPADGSPARDEEPAQPLALRLDEKAVVILSVLGELQMYARQDRPHSVASKAAAEALVLNVLGTHVMENAIAELLHSVMQRVVEEGTPVWAAHCEEVATKLFEGTTAPPPPLSATPSAQGPRVTDAANDDLMRCCALNEERESCGGRALRKLAWQEMTRGLTLEMSVANPVNKSATFAPSMPRLSNKKKD